MGALRLLLALCVVAGHSLTFFRPFFFVNAKAAVVCFFVISGFYMSLVLDGNYASRFEFLANRWHRIYVPYIVVTLLYGTYLFGAGRLQLGWNGDFTNLTLIGQDALRMLNRLPTPHDALGTDVVVVPQAWSLSVEL
jgi:peptidoglycan/LPS O-acetylase OafA/YrhL